MRNIIRLLKCNRKFLFNSESRAPNEQRQSCEKKLDPLFHSIREMNKNSEEKYPFSDSEKESNSFYCPFFNTICLLKLVIYSHDIHFSTLLPFQNDSNNSDRCIVFLQLKKLLL